MNSREPFLLIVIRGEISCCITEAIFYMLTFPCIKERSLFTRRSLGKCLLLPNPSPSSHLFIERFLFFIFFCEIYCIFLKAPNVCCFLFIISNIAHKFFGIMKLFSMRGFFFQAVIERFHEK